MLETLDSIDKAVFLWLNVTAANPVTDLIMPIVTSDLLLRVAYLVAMVALLVRGDRRLRWLVLFSVLVLTATDQASAHVLKPWIARPRPCHEGILANVHLLVPCGGGKAMPSSHAANALGQAFLFALGVRSVRWYLYTFAALVAISRVFVGVHYPGDVLAGALVGGLIGAAGAWLFERLRSVLRVPPQPTEGVRTTPAEDQSDVRRKPDGP